MITKAFKLFQYQKDAVERHLKILDSVGASLDGTGCGGGKTVIASAVAARFSLKTCVICPKSVVSKWESTLRAFRVEPLFVLNPEKLRAGNTDWLKRLPGGNKRANSAKFAWNLPERCLMIFDEAHMYGAYNSQNGKMLEAAAEHYVLMLSATAAESPLRMKAIGVNLRLFSGGYFWKWVREMGAEESRWGGLEWNPHLPQNKAAMDRLHHSVFANRGYRVTEEVLREQLPELMTEDEPLWLNPKDRTAIKELYEEMSDPKDPGGVKNLRQRQAIEKVKVPYLVERAKEIIEAGGSVVLFLNFHESIDAARIHFEEDCVLDGRVPAEKRRGIQARFQSNDLRIVIVQIAAGGQSIDLHDLDGRFPRVALLCPQFSGTVEEQAVGRISRVGAKSRALAIRLYAGGTIEQAALKLTAEKRDNVKILNAGEKSLNVSQWGDVSIPVTKVITPQPEEKAHSEHSPSSLKEKAKCPGFRNDQTRDKSAADRGTLGHLAVEKENLDVIPPDDPKLREAAGMCLKYLAALRKRLGPHRELREQRYQIQDQFGHIDHIILHGASAELIDYKFAWGEYVADSPQFWAYAVGLWDAHRDIELITVHVLLPFRGVIDQETWSREKDYERLSAQTTAIIAAARRDDPSTYLTGAHCAWCGRQASCPKLSSLALTIATQYKADELALPAQYDPANITDPNMMALAKKAAPIMKSWAEKVDARALEMRLNEGIEIPGWELAERKLPFKITDAQAAWDVVKGRISPEAFAACAEVKIGDLEKVIARTAQRGEMAKTKDQLRDALVDANAAKSEGTYHYLKRQK
jgi:superfamily II DNA or RNA helicase